MVRILVTNDDGIHSPGLRLLYEAVKELGEAIVVAPETPKSSSGLGITLHKPLRINRVNLWGVELYSINGTSSDVIHVALNELARDVGLVVSGVNIGDNTSVQVILSSGTVGAAAQAALIGIPAIAFSAAVSDGEDLEDPAYAEALKALIRSMASFVLEHGMPRDVDVLNVNFPPEITGKTRVRVVKPARMRFTEYIEKRLDPRGRPYYWVYGEPVTPEPGTDVYTVIVEKDVAITPLSFNLSPVMSEVDEKVLAMAREAEKILASRAR